MRPIETFSAVQLLNARGSMVEFVTVGRDKEITVTFRDGSEIKA